MVCLVVLRRKGREGGQSDMFFIGWLEKNFEKEIMKKRSEKAEGHLRGKCSKEQKSRCKGPEVGAFLVCLKTK